MARIKIEDLPILEKLSSEETRGLFGGMPKAFNPQPDPPHDPYDEANEYDRVLDEAPVTR